MPELHRRNTCVVATLLIASICSGTIADELSVAPASMARLGAVDERFQSYNVEMIEVTGGSFWKPYESKTRSAPVRGPDTAHPGPNDPAAGNSDLYEYRPPIDLTNSRLRKLAAALAPAYLRVSGSWANSTYFADSESTPSVPPAGFNAVLSRRQWQGVVDFSHAAGARIVTSFAVSPGARDVAGIWSPDQARRFLYYTRSVGGSVAAVEFMNEPDLAAMGGAPAGYDAAAYGRDFNLFHSFVKQEFAEIKVLGPGTIGTSVAASDLLAASGPGGIDVISYHHYGTLSERCGVASEPDMALSEERLARTDQALAFYQSVRDKFEPGKAIWLTETADAACGGNRLDATFLDTFRYLDQLGRLAKAGVQVVMHNTLAASDYGLLDEKTLAPRPNYWGALLWRRLMGSTVLDSGVPIQMGLHVYAHCQRGTPGGVSLLIINNDRDARHSLMLPVTSERYTLEAASLQDTTVRLNGVALRLGARDDLPHIEGAPTAAGSQTFAPATITFLTVPTALNKACQ
jgi:Glycosyl hydrolase family 79, N-terminal domain